MLSKVATRSKGLRSAIRMRQFSQLSKQDALVQNVVAKQPDTFYELQEFQHQALKEYFDQDALLYPIEEIISKVESRDYPFFLQNKNFLKVVDTLEKFQQNVVDLDSQAGRDFIVFKRQLYQLYEIQNRSMEEHEAFSFQIERENLKWLWNAKQDFSKEMDRANALEDLNAHANLKGKVFRRKTMDPKRLYGLGYFGVGALTYAYFPHMVLHFGQSLTTFAMISSSYMGMKTFQERDIVNSIEVVKDGENAGKILIQVSTSPFTSKSVIADPQDVQGVFSLGNDGMGEDDLESNLVFVTKYTQGGEQMEGGSFLLPADSWKDVNNLDWVLSIKNTTVKDETAELFDDLMIQNYTQKQEAGGMNALQVWVANQAYTHAGSDGALDQLIDKDHSSVDEYLVQMREFYGSEALSKMNPQDFYVNYKKFASGQVF